MMHLLFDIRVILDYIKDMAIKCMCSSSEFHFVWSYLYFTCVILYTSWSLHHLYLSEGLTVSDLKSKCDMIISQCHDSQPAYHIFI